MSAQAPAGWYPDNEGNERYWDGSAWTPHVRDVAATASKAVIGVPPKEGGLAKWKKLAADKQSERRLAKEEMARKQADAAQAAGALVTSGVFGMSAVEIFQGGYVRVASPPVNSAVPGTITNMTPYERLRSIRFSPPSQGAGGGLGTALEGAVGPAAAALMKGGAGLMKASAPGLAVAGVAHLASAEGRKSYLTIETDKQIHSLNNQTGNGVIKKINKAHNDVGAVLEAAGRRVLGQAEEDTVAAAPAFQPQPRAIESTAAPATPTLAERLRELAVLHQEGILSDEEFTSAKATLLGGL